MDYKLLLLDDDCDDRMLFTDAVKKVANDVVCESFSNAKQFMSNLQGDIGAKPNIIFLDINIPGTSGWDVLTALKQDANFKTIPVIMYSTSKHKSEILKAKALGAIAFFTKPSDFVMLKQAVKIVVEHLKEDNLHLLCTDSDIFY